VSLDSRLERNKEEEETGAPDIISETRLASPSENRCSAKGGGRLSRNTACFFFFFFFFTLVTGPRRSLGLKLSDTRVYEPQMLGRMNPGGGPKRENAPRRAAPRRTFSDRRMGPHSMHSMHSTPVGRYTLALRLSAAGSPYSPPSHSSGSMCPSLASNTEARRSFPS